MEYILWLLFCAAVVILTIVFGSALFFLFRSLNFWIMFFPAIALYGIAIIVSAVNRDVKKTEK